MALDWLNYHHLFYFWMAAKEGGVSRASAVLNVSQPAISRQVQALEDALGEKLFEKAGRGVVLTDVGRVVFQYADEIFALGRELRDVVRGRTPVRTKRFAVGVVDVVPKRIAYRLLQPAFSVEPRFRVRVLEDEPKQLLSMLALHEIDLVLSDAPLAGATDGRAFNHLLGQSGISFFAAPSVQRRVGPRFPANLESAPMLMPIDGTELRRNLDHWFESKGVRPEIVGEFDDSALVKAFGSAGVGVFPAPSVIADEVVRQYGVRLLGDADGVSERYYAISGERRLKHPGVVAITEAARRELFAR